MYVPKHFSQTDPDQLVQLMREFNFGTLITCVEGVPYASHIPFLISRNESGDIILSGHVAKSNPHWQMFGGDDSLIVFQGPHTYISPSWYETPGVPTWNYAAVHVTGIPQIVSGQDALYDIVIELSEQHEASNPAPWIPDFPDNMLTAIVGFTIRAKRIEGKYKLSQNRSEQDRSRVINELREPYGLNADENQLRIAAMMRIASEQLL
jgi:transcriptional regulator